MGGGRVMEEGEGSELSGGVSGSSEEWMGSLEAGVLGSVDDDEG